MAPTARNCLTTSLAALKAALHNLSAKIAFTLERADAVQVKDQPSTLSLSPPALDCNPAWSEAFSIDFSAARATNSARYTTAIDRRAWPAYNYASPHPPTDGHHPSCREMPAWRRHSCDQYFTAQPLNLELLRLSEHLVQLGQQKRTADELVSALSETIREEREETAKLSEELTQVKAIKKLGIGKLLVKCLKLEREVKRAESEIDGLRNVEKEWQRWGKGMEEVVAMLRTEIGEWRGRCQWLKAEVGRCEAEEGMIELETTGSRHENESTTLRQADHFE